MAIGPETKYIKSVELKGDGKSRIVCESYKFKEGWPFDYKVGDKVRFAGGLYGFPGNEKLLQFHIQSPLALE